MRWGIMGTGGIAGQMASVLAARGSSLSVVGSSDIGRAQQFAASNGISQAVSSHAAVAASDEVDVVYVATSHDQHHANVLAAIEHGKPVVCEKPLAINYRQAAEMLTAASRSGVFVMEGMWMAFQPFLAQVDDLIASGHVGDVKHLTAELSFLVPTDPTRRWLNKERGGGALLDLGVYTLSLAHHLLGLPSASKATATMAPSGVDLTMSIMSQHKSGASASMTSSFAANLSNEAYVAGSKGGIRIHAPFHHSPLLTVERAGDLVAEYRTEPDVHGFAFEVAEAERCIDAGHIESPLRPHDVTLDIMRWMDSVRRDCGIVYPADSED